MKTSMGLTAMHNAATNGHAEIVDALLTAGAAPNARALSNATAVFCAAGAGHTGIVRRLLAAGSEVGVAAGAGATALHAGAGAGHLAIVQDLLDAHADVDMQVRLPISFASCIGSAVNSETDSVLIHGSPEMELRDGAICVSAGPEWRDGVAQRCRRRPRSGGQGAVGRQGRR